MKISGKLLSAALASVLVFSLAGCGDKEESKTFNANLAGTEISIAYTYKGDKIIKQTAERKISYSTVGAKTKEDSAKILDSLSAKYKNIAGVEEKLTYEDTYAQENVSVDMEKVDFKALQQISGTMVSGDTSKGISMKQTQTLLEAAGFKEAK
ncbi:YehR family lipoprotein [Salmonella enterica]|uniref:YehR family lipoprotein n=1 Tax=Salmonella enterica TaxID=28901 RepID=UPI0023804711|nr:YehR family lipoprotein [Salmonella enterica]WDX74208.1 YehR family lipoprotein [Salmonella enterica subsp. enterica serovar Dublin]